MEVDYGRSVAEFVANQSLPKIVYPEKSLIGRYIPPRFVDHCRSKGQILPKQNLVLNGYSGIVKVEACLKQSDVDSKIEFGIIFSTTQVGWSGIRLRDDAIWRAENAGQALHRVETVVNSIVVSGANLEDEYAVEAGNFRSPKQTIYVSIDVGQIKITE